MKPPEEVRIDCDEPMQIVSALNAATLQLEADVRQRLNAAYYQYLVEGGVPELFERLNHRTVRQILDEFVHDNVPPLASGERDGVKFQLYEGRKNRDQSGND